MTVTHLATPAGSTLCDSAARWPVLTATPSSATCTRCGRALSRTVEREDDAWYERKRHAKVAAAVARTGLDEVWTFLTERGDTPTDRLLCGIFESFALALADLGYRRAL